MAWNYGSLEFGDDTVISAYVLLGALQVPVLEGLLFKISLEFDKVDPAAIAKSGYLTTASVIKLATDAGFELAAQSEINANPKDTKDYEKGVWTLPPSLTLGDTDREKYLAIGESDRMTLKFVKPAADKIFEQGTDSAGQPNDKQ